jgi:hypothetical protein
VGETNKASIRRGAVKFDLSGVPAGATINSVTLTLHLSKTTSGAQNAALHRALMDWGEGTSNAALAGNPNGGEGGGIHATNGDVTWFYTFFITQKWTTPGGDFVATASASTSVNGVGSYQWTGAGLVGDVQQWLSNPSMNFGWIVTGKRVAFFSFRGERKRRAGQSVSGPIPHPPQDPQVFATAGQRGRQLRDRNCSPTVPRVQHSEGQEKTGRITRDRPHQA